jgi:hypothetical protein
MRIVTGDFASRLDRKITHDEPCCTRMRLLKSLGRPLNASHKTWQGEVGLTVFTKATKPWAGWRQLPSVGQHS